VQKRLKGKSKVGVFLSGGIDSSIIAYLVKKNFRDVIFLSVGTDKSSDLLFAGSLAKYLRAPHYIHRYDVREMRAVLPKVIYHLESFDALLVRRSIPNFIVARLAKKKGVDTVFIGEGGDELFAGYEWLKNLRGRDLHDKLMDFMPVLHNTGFQRCDRMPLSLGIEAKIPFFDAEFIRFALKISPSLKISDRKQEKWVLRKSFEDFLPSEIVWRKKQKFSQGAGSYEIMARVADKEISDAEFRREKLIEDGSILKNKEELLYYRIFRKFFPYDSILPNVGRSI